jgi:hypothetical protein
MGGVEEGDSGLRQSGTHPSASARTDGAPANSTEASVVASKDSSQRELRAYLGVGVGGAVYQEREKGTHFGPLPKLVNTGKTPAYNVTWVAKSAVLPKELSPGHVFSELGDGSGKTVVGINQQINLHAVSVGFVPDDEVQDIKYNERDKALYTWGIVHYDDAFGNKRYTRFCHRLMWLRDSVEIYGYFVPNRNESD